MKNIKIAILCALTALACNLSAAPPDAPTGFKTNNTPNPLGIDTSNPRFSWVVNDTDRGEKQTAYQIIVASSLAGIGNNIGDRWNSGKVMSEQQSDVSYNGIPLTSQSNYWVKTRTWDKDGNVSAWSGAATFETAFLNAKSEWTAKMLVGDFWRYRKQFTLPNKTIAKARAYVSAKDTYDLRINGSRIGESVVNSDAANFNVRKWYTTHDVTAQLASGASNTMGVFVGSMRVGFQASWGTYASRGFTLQLEVTYTDGTRTTVGSDTTWKCTKTGPFINTERNNMYDGEKFDARNDDAWDSNGYDDSTWSNSTLVANTAKMTARYMESMRVTETRTPISVTTPVVGTYIFDMGQNMSGWTQLTVAGAAGTPVTMKYGEKLTAGGLVDQSNLKVFAVGAEQTNKYILKGGGTEVWEPMFALHGFRYVEVTGFPGIPTANSLKGKVVHQAVDMDDATKGSFSCSDPLLNKIHNAFLWGTKNNMSCGMPTDCPQRDERFGWLGDALLVAEGTAYNYQVESFFSQWLTSVFDCQANSGYIDSAGPIQGKWGDTLTSGGDVPWSSASVLIPYKCYLTYGNKSSLEQIYGKMKSYLNWLQSTQNADYTHSRNQWQDHGHWQTDAGLLSTAFYFRVADTLSKIALDLGYTADATEFATRANLVKNAFNAKYLITNSYYLGNTQTANAIPLAFNMVPDNAKSAVVSSLVARVVADQYTMRAGILGTYCMFEALCENGREDVAFRLATQTVGPSWGNWIQNMNATTMFEFWDGTKSQNHAYFGGPIDSYFYKYLAGISPATPGYGRIKIKPNLLQALTQVDAVVNTYRGPISCSWSTAAMTVTVNVDVPVNSQAELYVPSRGYGTSRISITEGGTMIWRNGVSTGGIANVGFVRTDGDYVVFNVGSGGYSFVMTDPCPPLVNAGPDQTVSLVSATPPLGWNYSAWTGNADSAISNAYTYTAAHCFGNNRTSTTVNNVTFTESFNTSGTGWSIGGNVATWNGDDDAAVTGTSEDLAEEFIFNGGPRTVTFSGLTVGQAYEVIFYSVAWEDGARTQTFSGTSQTPLILNQNTYGNNKGIKISCVYVATGTNQTFTITPSTGGSFHLYAMLNRHINFFTTAYLDGSVSDAGGQTPAFAWSIFSGPAVAFGNSNNIDTTATFTAAGIHTLRLTATGGSTQVSDDVVVTVNPVSTGHAITYNGNGSTGGNVPVDANRYSSGATATVLGNTASLVRTGFTFAGWNTQADGLGTTYSAGSTFSISSHVTLHARWSSLPTYAVNYNTNGATSGTAPSTQIKVQGIPLILASNSGNLAKTGYAFAGWNTASNGGGADFAVGTSYTTDAVVTLYAKWTAIAVLTVTPAGDLLSTRTGGAFSPSSIQYTLTNSGTASLNWTAGKTTAWLNISATSGTLAVGASTTVTVSFNSGANSLGVGTYNDTVTFTSNSNTTRAVLLTVSNTPPSVNAGLGQAVSLVSVTPSLGWSYSAWTGDSDSAISSANTYTAAHCFGNNHPSVAVNNVTFTESFNTSGTGWSVGGSVANATDADAAVTGNSEDLAEEFIFAGSPRTVTFSGLTVGQAYEVIFYSVALADSARTQTFSGTAQTPLILNQNIYGNNNGIKILSGYLATATSQTFTIAPSTGGSFHLYALLNRQSIVANATANLDGTVSDTDGQTLTTTWSTVNGPAAVTFGNNSNIDTTATFAVAGIYTLRLTASDGLTQVSNDVVVTVNPVSTGIVSPTLSYQSWGEGLSLITDSNKDGTADGIAWLLGAENSSVNVTPLLPTFDNTTDADYLIYTYRRSDAAINDPVMTIAVQYGDSPASWTNAVHDGTNIIIIPINDFYGAGVDKVDVKIKKSLATSGKLFGRLSLQSN